MNDSLQAPYLDIIIDALGIQRWHLRDADKTAIPAASKDGQPGSTVWEKLTAQVAACQACDLSRGRTQTVFGVGNREAQLMVVGEAPGYHEDHIGEPFVGKAGHLLTAMLASIGLTREQVYIANVLKCRPPNNRDPLPEEVEKCTPYLEQQVALIKPTLIFAVGRYAAHYLLGVKTPLSRLRGSTYQFRNTEIPLIVSYHPAYLLRNPADKRLAYQDLLRVKQMLTYNIRPKGNKNNV